MNKNIEDLYEFIDRAAKSRKYPETTAQGLRTALKLFDAVLNDEERQSLDVFKNNLEQIYHSVTVKNGKTFSVNSLAAYKSRVIKILTDFDKYGVDPTKMTSWSPKIITRGPKKNTVANKSKEGGEEFSEEIQTPSSSAGMHKIELALRPDKKFVVMVPMDITQGESNTIKAVLDSLVVKE
jgi:hypothetical protein